MLRLKNILSIITAIIVTIIIAIPIIEDTDVYDEDGSNIDNVPAVSNSLEASLSISDIVVENMSVTDDKGENYDTIEGGNLQSDQHEMGKVFSFQPHNSTATNSVRPFCKNCNNYFGYTLFRGAPTDLSYLDVVKEYIDGVEIIGGEYYTVRAIVTLCDYEPTKTKIRCKVESENTLVGFSVEFRGEFEERVSLLEKGDEVVFSGRLYDEGFGFTDCELVNN